MILATVGTQLPFDRLIRILDGLAPSLGEPIFAQLGNTTYVPHHLDFAESLSATEMQQRILDCSLMVAHAGMGTIIAARRHRRPLVVFPREVRHGEIRSDHQLAACDQLGSLPNVYVARDAEALQRLVTDPKIRTFVAPEGGPTRRLQDELGPLLKRLVSSRVSPSSEGSD